MPPKPAAGKPVVRFGADTGDVGDAGAAIGPPTEDNPFGAPISTAAAAAAARNNEAATSANRKPPNAYSYGFPGPSSASAAAASAVVGAAKTPEQRAFDARIAAANAAAANSAPPTVRPSLSQSQRPPAQPAPQPQPQQQPPQQRPPQQPTIAALPPQQSYPENGYDDERPAPVRARPPPKQYTKPKEPKRSDFYADDEEDDEEDEEEDDEEAHPPRRNKSRAAAAPKQQSKVPSKPVAKSKASAAPAVATKAPHVQRTASKPKVVRHNKDEEYDAEYDDDHDDGDYSDGEESDTLSEGAFDSASAAERKVAVLTFAAWVFIAVIVVLLCVIWWYKAKADGSAAGAALAASSLAHLETGSRMTRPHRAVCYMRRSSHHKSELLGTVEFVLDPPPHPKANIAAHHPIGGHAPSPAPAHAPAAHSKGAHPLIHAAGHGPAHGHGHGHGILPIPLPHLGGGHHRRPHPRHHNHPHKPHRPRGHPMKRLRGGRGPSLLEIGVRVDTTSHERVSHEALPPPASPRMRLVTEWSAEFGARALHPHGDENGYSLVLLKSCPERYPNRIDTTRLELYNPLRAKSMCDAVGHLETLGARYPPAQSPNPHSQSYRFERALIDTAPLRRGARATKGTRWSLNTVLGRCLGLVQFPRGQSCKSADTDPALLGRSLISYCAVVRHDAPVPPLALLQQAHAPTPGAGGDLHAGGAASPTASDSFVTTEVDRLRAAAAAAFSQNRAAVHAVGAAANANAAQHHVPPRTVAASEHEFEVREKEIDKAEERILKRTNELLEKETEAQRYARWMEEKKRQQALALREALSGTPNAHHLPPQPGAGVAAHTALPHPPPHMQHQGVRDRPTSAELLRLREFAHPPAHVLPARPTPPPAPAPKPVAAPAPPASAATADDESDEEFVPDTPTPPAVATHKPAPLPPPAAHHPPAAPAHAVPPSHPPPAPAAHGGAPGPGSQFPFSLSSDSDDDSGDSGTIDLPTD